MNKFIREIASKEIFPQILLVLNSFVWHILIYVIMHYKIIDELNISQIYKNVLFSMYFLSVVVSAIIGAKIFPRARIKYLYHWLFIGILATSTLIMISDENMITNYFSVTFIGISIGIGLPSCMSLFADSTSVENRGFISGTSWTIIGFTTFIFALLTSFLTLQDIVIILILWRLLGALCFVLLTKNYCKQTLKLSTPSYPSLIRKKEMLLYLLPWITFSIINFAESPLLEKVFGTETFTFVGLVEYIIIGLTALIGGYSADYFGRKKVVIFGFIMVGVEYAALSIFYELPFIAYLFMFLDGITWGLFFPVFFMTVWGDLGEQYVKEKYYVLGGLPFILANYVSILVEPYVEVISPSAAFSFASFFLFLAVVPLMYAPETLPEKVIKDRELKSYLEKAKRISEKYS